MPLPYPRTSNGYIDECELFKLVVGTLGQPITVLDELSVHQVSLLLQNYWDTRKEFFELVAYAVQVGTVRANGKKIKEMFPKSEAEKVQKHTATDMDSKREQLKQLEKLLAD